MKIPEIKLVPKPETEEAQSAVGYKWNDVADCMVIHQFVCFGCFEVICQLNQI